MLADNRIFAQRAKLRLERDRNKTAREIAHLAVLIERPFINAKRVTPDRIDHSEWPHLPSKAPHHHAIDIEDSVADLFFKMNRVAQCCRKVVAQEFAQFILELQRLSHALAKRKSRKFAQGWQLAIAPHAIRHGLQIECD